MRYQLLHNLDKYDRSERNADNLDGEHRDWHRLAPYYEGTIAEPSDGDLFGTAWVLFQRHNRDDRPCGQVGPSLSIGDVILMHPAGEPSRAMTLTQPGRWVEVDTLDVLSVSYLEMIAARR